MWSGPARISQKIWPTSCVYSSDISRSPLGGARWVVLTPNKPEYGRLVDALTRHQANAKVALECVRAVANLAREASEEAIDALVEDGVPSLVVAVLDVGRERPRGPAPPAPQTPIVAVAPPVLGRHRRPR